MAELEQSDLLDQVKRLTGAGNSVPLYQIPPFEYDTRVSAAQNVELVSTQAVSGGTAVVIRWLRPEDPNIDRFEIWISRTAYTSEQPYLVASVKDSPASFTVTADRATTAIAYIRTIMKDGLATDINASPTVTFSVSNTVDAANLTNLSSVTISSFSGNLDVSHIDNLNTIAVSYFSGNLDVSRVSNLNTIAISSFSGQLDISRVNNVYNLLIANFTGNLDMSRVNNLYNLTIGNFAGTLVIGQISDGLITSAKIASLDVGKLNAGTINVAVELTAGKITCTDNSVTTKLLNGSFAGYTAGFVSYFTVGGSSPVLISPGYMAFYDNTTNWNVRVSISGGANGNITVNNSGGSLRVAINGGNQAGTISLYGTSQIDIDASNGWLSIGGNRVLSSRQTDPGAPSFASLADAQSWCSALRTSLRNHGLI